MKANLKNILKSYGFEVTEWQAEQFKLYYEFLIQENQKFNLTAITEENEVIIKHFLDSILPIQEIKKDATLLDVGSGAGFPGIPIKIMRPDLKITLLDSLQKRVNFLNNVIELLKLTNISAVHGRAEDYALKKRESFDYVVSRAVAQTNTLVEYLVPFLKVGGTALLYKSAKLDEELGCSVNAIKILGGKIENIKEYEIKENDLQRKIVLIKKTNKTPIKFPRGKNLPKNKPIL